MRNKGGPTEHVYRAFALTSVSKALIIFELKYARSAAQIQFKFNEISTPILSTIGLKSQFVI